MKVAFIHVLPLELYPPATNLLGLMSRRRGWKIRAWSTINRRGEESWSAPNVSVIRHSYPAENVPLPLRMPAYLAWHSRAAMEITRWKPDALMVVEPHSALAAWIYYRVLRGSAPLFIHHHEYYAPEDFAAPGMRLLRSTLRLERDDLFPRAAWVSQTNDERLALLKLWNPTIRENAASVFPNYPPRDWIARANAVAAAKPDARTRFVYLGSASFEDTFIREICLWAAARPDTVSLHICGNNIREDVWDWIHSLSSANITTEPAGVAYEQLPTLLRHFDAGLVLYRGNTLNFIHNVPNKAIEYLACGLHVWYPRQMTALRNFHRRHPYLHLEEIDFENLAPMMDLSVPVRDDASEFPFDAESTAGPLLARMESLAAPEGR